jgi:anti-sigma factor RsiW
MNCVETTPLISAYADGELDLLRSHSVKKHLHHCTECIATYENVKSLSEKLRAEAPYFAVPPSLLAHVRATLRDTSAAEPPIRSRPTGNRSRWFLGGAVAGCAATLLVWIFGTTILQWRANEDLAVEAVSIHVRATLGNHLIMVASSDRHTVKPWLSARLDYSPPVQDFTNEGFPLIGGRVDYLDGHPVAVIVYRYRLHTIDVFVRPESSRVPVLALRTVRGFNVAHASGSSMDWFAVSDVSADVLAPFVQRLAHGTASTP